MKQNEIPVIPCTKCGGSGHVPLPGHLWRTLHVLYLADADMTTPRVAEDLQSVYGETVYLTAVCNRLRTLEELGLAEKYKTAAPTGGCWHVWRKVKTDEA